MHTARVVAQSGGRQNLLIEWHLPRVFALEVDAMSAYFGISTEQVVVEIGDTQVRAADLLERIRIANPGDQPQSEWIVVIDGKPFPVLPLQTDALAQRVDELVNQSNDYLPEPVRLNVVLPWAHDINPDELSEKLIKQLVAAEVLAWQSYALGRNGLVLSLLDCRHAMVYDSQWPLCEMTRDDALIERAEFATIMRTSNDLFDSAGLKETFDRILSGEHVMDDGPELS